MRGRYKLISEHGPIIVNDLARRIERDHENGRISDEDADVLLEMCSDLSLRCQMTYDQREKGGVKWQL